MVVACGIAESMDSIRSTLEPTLQVGDCRGSELVQKRARLSADGNERPQFGPDEPFIHGMVDKRDEVVEETIDIQQAHRLAMEVQLGPRDHLEQLLQGAVSSGEGDEAIGEVHHHLFAFVHGLNHVQGITAIVTQLKALQLLRDDTDYLAPTFENRIRDGAH